MSSSVNSVASSTHMSVMPVMDLIFSLSSMPLNRNMESFGSSIVNTDLLMVHSSYSCHSISVSSISCHTESLSVAPTLRMTSILRFSFSALSSSFCAMKNDLPDPAPP